MGCWNESCMLTGLPIYSGDRTYAVMLMENSLRGHSCYATNSYIPVAIMEGTYNDYGSLEMCEQPEPGNIPRRIISVLKKHVKKDLSFMKDLSQVVTSMEDYNVHDLIDAANINHLGFLVPEGFQKSLQAKPFVEIKFVFLKADVVDEIIDDCDQKNSVYEKDKYLWDDLFTPNMKDKPSLALSVHDLESLNEMYRCLSLDMAGNIATKTFVMELLELSQYDEAIRKMYFKLIQVNVILQRLRKAWYIPSGAGSQDGYDPIYAVFLKVYRNNLEEMLHEMDVDMDDDEDYDEEDD